MVVSKSFACELMGGVAALAIAGTAQAQGRFFDLPTEPASQAIPDFAYQARLQIIAPADQLYGVITPAIHGDYDARRALALLLQRTGLVVASDDGSVIVLKAQAAPHVQRVAQKRIELAQAQAAGAPAGVGYPAAASGAQAASSEPGPAPAKAGAASLPEVIVTAQRRQENLQRVPIAISSFNRQDLDDKQLYTTLDVTRQVPNMFSSQAAGNQAGANSYSLRGISNTESISTRESPIGTYIDDIYIARQAFNNVVLFDVSQVDVLRGPQGTLFGHNTTGGAVVVTSTKPSDTFYANGSVEGGSRDQISGRLEINIPVTDRFFIQMTGVDSSINGFYRSAVTNTTVGDEADKGVRLAARYIASPNLEWFGSAEFISVEGLAPSIPSNPAIEGKEGKAATAFDSFSTVNTALPTCSNGRNAFAWLANKCQDSISTAKTFISNFKWTVGDVAINFITGVRDTSEQYTTDFEENNPDYSFPNFFLTNDAEFKQISQEIKATGDVLDGRIKYVTGFYFFHEEDKTVIGEEYGFPNPITVPGDTSGLINSSLENLRNRTNSYAAYLQTDTKLTNKLTLTTGIRYTIDSKSVGVNYDAIDPAFGSSYTTSDLATSKIHAHRATPKISLQYQYTPEIMAYASATNGFKSGGWNARASSAAAFTPFYDEVVWSYETGVRTQFFENRLQVNADIFQANYHGLQISAVDQNTVPHVFTTLNAGDQRDRGFEFESHAILLPGLKADLALGLQDAKYTALTSGALQAGFSTSGGVIDTPPVTLTAGLSYSVAAPRIGGDLHFAANVMYAPSYNSQPVVTDVTQEGNPVNATASYTTGNGHYTFEVFCRNCFRDVYIADPGGTGNYLGELPFFGARLRFHLQ